MCYHCRVNIVEAEMGTVGKTVTLPKGEIVTDLRPVRHSWYEPKGLPSMKVCSMCGATQHTVGADSFCLRARSANEDLDALYRARRKAADNADSGRYGGWAKLEQIESQLREVDPDGAWRTEGNRFDGRGWVSSSMEVL